MMDLLAFEMERTILACCMGPGAPGRSVATLFVSFNLIGDTSDGPSIDIHQPCHRHHSDVGRMLLLLLLLLLRVCISCVSAQKPAHI